MSNVFFFGLILLGIGGFLFAGGFKWWNQRNLIRDTPMSKVRGIAMGPIEVHGKVIPAQKKILKSPFSNKDCVYYKYTIEEYRRQGKSSSWVQVKGGEQHSFFFIEDETGGVLVDPLGATIEIPADGKYNSNFGRDPPKQVKSFLQTQGIGFEGLFGANKKMRYTEYFIAPGDELYVIGRAGKNPHIEEGSAVRGTDNIMIQKGSFYYISDKAETEVLKSFKWKVIGGLWGGGAMIIIGLTLLFLA